MRSEEKPNITEEIQLIPAWSVILAGLIFVGIQAAMHLYLWSRPKPTPPPIGFRIFWSMFTGAVMAAYTLMVGYVTRDAKRRNMNAGLWTLIVVFMPGAIGLVVYFLLRQPSRILCPRCSERVQSSFNFCPRCKFQLAPVCESCHHTVSLTDTFCYNCGHSLAAQEMTLESSRG